MVICLEQGANDVHIFQLMPLPPHHRLLSLKSRFNCSGAHLPRLSGKEAIKQVSVCNKLHSENWKRKDY